MMKILVPVKRVLDPALRPRISDDARNLDVQGLKHAINPFDEVALEKALRLREQGAATEITVVGIGPEGRQEALRSALALGADKAVAVIADTLPESLAVAKILQKIAEREGSSLVLMGKQSSDTDMGATGPILAARLGWPQATQIYALDYQDGILAAERETGDGIEKSVFKAPAVVSVDLRLNDPRFAKLPDIMKARKKPIETLSADDLGVDISPRVDTLEYAPPPAKQGVKMLGDVQELIAKLREEVEKL